MEEPDVRDRPAVQLLEDRRRVGPLDLEAVVHALDPVAVGPRRRARVAGDPHVVRAERAVVLDPVRRRRPADQHEPVLALAKADHVADHVALGADRHEVLGPVRPEALEAVDRQPLQEPLGIRPLDDHLVHVVRLVEQHRRVAPGLLLVAPVAELGRDDRIDIHPDPRIPQHPHGVAALRQHGLQAGLRHRRSPPGHVVDASTVSPNAPADASRMQGRTRLACHAIADGVEVPFGGGTDRRRRGAARPEPAKARHCLAPVRRPERASAEAEGGPP